MRSNILINSLLLLSHGLLAKTEQGVLDGLQPYAVNSYCHNSRTPGVCINTSTCTSAGGTYESGNCPSDAADVKCCTKPSCGSQGECRWTNGGTSSCSGTTQSGLCPGPSAFKCCLASGTWPEPSFGKSNCKAHVVSAGEKIIEHFEGEINIVYCYADRPNTDHNQGLALDIMVGTYNPIGWEIAEWVMNDHQSSKVKYVIWGQKIWSVEVDINPKSWESWRPMDDRGDVTANHWFV